MSSIAGTYRGISIEILPEPFKLGYEFHAVGADIVRMCCWKGTTVDAAFDVCGVMWAEPNVAGASRPITIRS